MSVFREMSVEWEGERYTFSPSNKFLRRIDREVSLAGLAARADRGEAPIFDMAFVIAEILAEAGVETDEDQVIAIITDEDEGDRAKYLVGLINDLMPKGKSTGGSVAPKKTQAKRKK
jgi:hypothetical protein